MQETDKSMRASVDALATLPSEDVIFGQTEAMREIRERIKRIAETNVPFLIRGASGTGKEVIAKVLHSWSSYSSGPFVKVHCPAIPGTLLESELFGHEEGSFTGASHAMPGLVETADRGTLFLDEIAELDTAIQAKLLHLLQDGQVCRIGARTQRAVDVRIVCATHRGLEQEMEIGKFREDLYYRINVISVKLPLLRDRIDDIPGLADYFLHFYNSKYDRQAPAFSDECIQRMQDYEWPGNIRELENLINAYVVLGPEEAMMGKLLEAHVNPSGSEVLSEGSLSLKKLARHAARTAERKAILRVLAESKGSRKHAARALNISYRALLYKIKEAGIPPKRRVHLPTIPVFPQLN